MDQSLVQYVQKSVDSAKAINADFILLDINSHGGLVTSGDNIRSILMGCNIRVLSFVRFNAISGAAYIAMMGDQLYMHPEASIGAVTVVDQHKDILEVKYQRVMRSKMKTLAISKGRSEDIAQKMVGTIDSSGKVVDVLVLTAHEALEESYCDAICENVEQIFSDRLGPETPYKIYSTKLPSDPNYKKEVRILQGKATWLTIALGFSGLVVIFSFAFAWEYRKKLKKLKKELENEQAEE